MILIHTALLSEAQSFIEFFKLQLIQKEPRIYIKDNIVLLVSGIGKENTIKSLILIFKKYNINKAINIGVAGCSSRDIKIGELFCVNKKLNNIKYMKLKTVDQPIDSNHIKINGNHLFDMEAKYFIKIAHQYLSDKDIFVFKIVSDYLNTKILEKDFIKSLIYKNIKDITANSIF